MPLNVINTWIAIITLKKVWSLKNIDESIIWTDYLAHSSAVTVRNPPWLDAGVPDEDPTCLAAVEDGATLGLPLWDSSPCILGLHSAWAAVGCDYRRLNCWADSWTLLDMRYRRNEKGDHTHTEGATTVADCVFRVAQQGTEACCSWILVGTSYEFVPLAIPGKFLELARQTRFASSAFRSTFIAQSLLGSKVISGRYFWMCNRYESLSVAAALIEM